MVQLNKLPKIIELNEFGGNYRLYIDAVYEVFFEDFINHEAFFGSKKLMLKSNPRFQNRAYTFYHMTHKGENEDERTPDLRRCERIGWAKPCIENVDLWSLKFWRQSRKRSENRVCILLDVEDDHDYFVVLEVRETYVLLWTAFVSIHPHETRKKLKEYTIWKAGMGANINTPDQLIGQIQAEIESKRRHMPSP